MQDELTPHQRRVVDAVIEHILNPSKGQLVGLVSGKGGTGKTQIIKVIKLFVQTVFGKVEGSVGCCAIRAPTGPAAFNVGGDTWQSLFHRGHTKLAKKKTDIKGVKDLRDRFKGLQLLMFDEVSMIGALAIFFLVTPRISLYASCSVLLDTSHVTRHTSHVTRHTSHVTRHLAS